MDKLEEIFERQRSYLRTLAPIYIQNGPHFEWHATPFPWDLDDRQHQEGFRLLAWRCVEEVTEAINVYWLCHDDRTFWESGEAQRAFHEEVSDVFHFFIELCLATGITPADLSWVVGHEHVKDKLNRAFAHCGEGRNETMPQRWSFFIHKLGLAMQQLRQRPWRTDDRKTDRSAYNYAMAAAYLTFISACKRSGINAESLHNAFFAKAKINDKRIADQV